MEKLGKRYGKKNDKIKAVANLYGASLRLLYHLNCDPTLLDGLVEKT